MNVIWRKVWRDLWRNKFRTFLVVLSTAVGVFALGLVFGLSGVMRARMTESHQATRYPHISFYTNQFGGAALSAADVIDAIRHEPDIADAEGEDLAVFRWKKEGEAYWRDGYVLARADYGTQQLGLNELLDGEWPSRSRASLGRTLAVERLSSQYFDLPIGTSIVVEFGRYERRLPIEGIVRPAQMFPPQFGGNAVFFASPETFSWLTGWDEGFNRLHVCLESYSSENAMDAGERVKERLERMGVYVGGYEIFDPQVHWLQEQLDAVFLILTALGALSLGLSGFLIVNIMNATVTQQVWQIGVMKAVGASAGRVARVYLATALVYGLLSLALAVPLGTVAAHVLAGVLLNLLNIAAGPFRLMPIAALIQVAAGLVVPLLAALVPVIGSARITVRACLSSYGLGAGFGRSWLDRLVGRLRWLPRPLALSLRNTFRRKARIALTLLTLMLGGVMFIVVMSVNSSVHNTLELLLDDFGFDVLVGLNGSYRVVRLVEVAEGVPGLDRAEVWWREGGAQLLLVNGAQRGIGLWGVPSDSEMFRPRIVSGRALLPDDGRAILLNAKIAADENIQVGDEIELTINERESTWTVVGLILNINNNQRDNFCPFDALARATGNVNRGVIVMAASRAHDPDTQQRLARDLRDAYTRHRIGISSTRTAADAQQEDQAQFNLITYLMLAMAGLAAVVGSVGLMSTMSINVVERAREIGVMRAVGASSPAILRIFVAEGVLIGALSWLVAVPFSYPGARLLSHAVGVAWMKIPLDFSYSISGLALWLVIVAVLSALASLWPALRATRVSAWEALAYE